MSGTENGASLNTSNVKAKDQEVFSFLIQKLNRISEVKKRLRQETAEKVGRLAVMLAAPDQCEHMAWLVRVAGCRRGIELGVFTGYSALCLAEALPEDGQLIACDVSQEWTDVGRPYWEEAGVAHKIDLRLRPGLETLDELLADPANHAAFDFAFIDADKPNYPHYYERLIALLRPGGFLLIDNILWSGKVASQHERDASPDTRAIYEVGQIAINDDRVHVHTINIGDGLLIATKK